MDFLPHWTPWQWGVGAAVILVAAVLETSFQRKQEAISAHAKEVGGLQGQISGLKTTVERLEERMKEGPSVVMSNVGTGINLRVESLKQDAINVRLAQANTKNYFINSDVIRLLKVGAPETLVLHCHPLQAGGSLVLQGFLPRRFSLTTRWRWKAKRWRSTVPVGHDASDRAASGDGT